MEQAHVAGRSAAGWLVEALATGSSQILGADWDSYTSPGAQGDMAARAAAPQPATAAKLAAASRGATERPGATRTAVGPNVGRSARSVGANDRGEPASRSPSPSRGRLPAGWAPPGRQPRGSAQPVMRDGTFRAMVQHEQWTMSTTCNHRRQRSGAARRRAPGHCLGTPRTVGPGRSTKPSRSPEGTASLFPKTSSSSSRMISSRRMRTRCGASFKPTDP